MAEKPKDAKTVRLVRDPGEYPPPHECDCHPAEVADFAAGGWVKPEKRKTE